MLPTDTRGVRFITMNSPIGTAIGSAIVVVAWMLPLIFPVTVPGAWIPWALASFGAMIVVFAFVLYTPPTENRFRETLNELVNMSGDYKLLLFVVALLPMAGLGFAMYTVAHNPDVPNVMVLILQPVMISLGTIVFFFSANPRRMRDT